MIAVPRLLEGNAETLASLITREIGRPIREARGEVLEAIDTCALFLAETAASPMVVRVPWPG